MGDLLIQGYRDKGIQRDGEEGFAPLRAEEREAV